MDNKKYIKFNNNIKKTAEKVIETNKTNFTDGYEVMHMDAAISNGEDYYGLDELDQFKLETAINDNSSTLNKTFFTIFSLIAINLNLVNEKEISDEISTYVELAHQTFDDVCIENDIDKVEAKKFFNNTFNDKVLILAKQIFGVAALSDDFFNLDIYFHFNEKFQEVYENLVNIYILNLENEANLSFKSTSENKYNFVYNITNLEKIVKQDIHNIKINNKEMFK